MAIRAVRVLRTAKIERETRCFPRAERTGKEDQKDKTGGGWRKSIPNPNTERKAEVEAFVPGTVPARELAEVAIPVPGGVGPIGKAKARSAGSEDTAFSGRAEDRAPGRSGQPAPEPSLGVGRGLPDARPMPRRASVTYTKARTGIRDAPDSLFPHLCRAASAGQAQGAAPATGGGRSPPKAGRCKKLIAILRRSSE